MTEHIEDAADRDWIRRALERHERGLVAYARRLTGDLDAARDVVQEAFLRLCREEREDVEPRLFEWLLRVCRNLSVDRRRKETRMSTMSEETAASAVSHAPPPTEGVERADAIAQVLRNLAQLPARQREVLRLKFQEGLSYAEIGRVTDTNPGTVGWLIHEGLKSLRERLTGDTAQNTKGARA